MFPGYGDCPYHTPIRVHSIEALGNRQFRFRFLNLYYAAGVQDFDKCLLTLRRGASHLVAQETEVEGRTYVLATFNSMWLQRHFPALRDEAFFDPTGQPIEDALIRAAGW
jgi:hypothetical protein